MPRSRETLVSQLRSQAIRAAIEDAVTAIVALSSIGVNRRKLTSTLSDSPEEKKEELEKKRERGKDLARFM